MCNRSDSSYPSNVPEVVARKVAEASREALAFAERAHGFAHLSNTVSDMCTMLAYDETLPVSSELPGGPGNVQQERFEQLSEACGLSDFSNVLHHISDILGHHEPVYSLLELREKLGVDGPAKGIRLEG